ncbi:MAG: CBS domain-containing protein [Nitrososphaera sp.]|jgi:CBS domain-containing protein
MSQSTVAQYMNERLVTINIKSTARDIAKLMDKNNVSSVLVTDDNNDIIGIFTERDIVRIISRDLQPDRIIVISPPLVYVDANLSMEQASATMLKNKVRHLLVKDPISKEIVGIMTNTDFAKYLRNQSVSKGFESILEAAAIEMLNY